MTLPQKSIERLPCAKGAKLREKNVSLHGIRPWHPRMFVHLPHSGQRDLPRRQAVASISSFDTISEVGGILTQFPKFVAGTNYELAKSVAGAIGL